MTGTTRIDTVNILLVDDQPAKLLSYEAILGELGETLLMASSAREALECLLKNDIAVVLIDVCMPELDGYELAAMIRQHPRFQQTSIIFVSAILMTEFDRLRGYECGAVDYVPVPVIPEILRAKVSVFAELHRKTRALERLNRELEERVTERTTELAMTTAKLQETDRRKDEFLAMLAHELRNPLAPIRTAVELLRLRELAESQRVHARDIIERQVGSLVCLIDELLDVSRITRGMITLHREPVLIAAIVAHAVETARPLIDARRHDLTLDLPQELITVDGDKTRLAQVISNLLQNAAKFTDAGGRIVLKASRKGRHAIISVKDTGIGIPKELVPTVFELFTRCHPESDLGQGGLGVGLALARRLTEMHEGTITVHSDGPGQGAEFVVSLPLLATEAAPARDHSHESQGIPAVAPRRVLIVDDSHDAAESLAMLLELRGHEVRMAHDGLEALAVAETFKPHIALLDLGMPKMDGYEAAREMRRHAWGKSATLIAITGWGQQQDRQRTAEAGFDAHLVKPVTAADVLHAVAASLSQEAAS